MNEMMTDRQEREIWFSILLKKQGMKDKYFDELVKELTKKLKQLELVGWDGMPQRFLDSLIGLSKPENLIYDLGDLTAFEFQVPRNCIPQDKGSQYDKIKRDMQSLIKRERKYATCSLANTWNYTLTEEEAKEFDILKVLSGVWQQLCGMQVDFNPKELSQDEIEMARKEFIKPLINEIYLILKLTLKTSYLNDSFYDKIEHLLDYLYANGLVRKQSMPDIKERYLKAVEDCNAESMIPHTFIFYVECWPKTIEKFLLLKEETLKEIKETEYQIRLDSNPFHSDSCGCFLHGQ